VRLNLFHRAGSVSFLSRRFLQGSCLKGSECLLSHKVAPDKMPVCKFFLEGVCARDDCPYRHVKVSADAKVCPAFLRGHCPLGQECRMRHEAPKADGTAYKTSAVKRRKSGKTPPAKPKRKSLLLTPAAEKKTEDQSGEDLSKHKGRYFDATSTKEEEEVDTESSTSGALEAKRKRLLRKVELAKKTWGGQGEDNLDDSGPYEEIDEGPAPCEDVRAPMGELPSFIPLDSDAETLNLPSENVREAVEEPQEGEEVDERLI